MSPSKPVSSVANHPQAMSSLHGANKENHMPPSTLLTGSAKFEPVGSSPSKSQRAVLDTPRKQAMQPFSPRKHIAQSSGVSFTPHRPQLPPPRAWERIPAKPYAAAREGQKIWKRVPLQDVGFDANIQGQESRREKEAKQDYLRAVKRMKVDVDQVDQGTDGANANDGQPGFCATRFEEESIEMGGSPKKKVRSLQVVQSAVEDKQDFDLEKTWATSQNENTKLDPVETELEAVANQDTLSKDDVEGASGFQDTPQTTEKVVPQLDESARLHQDQTTSSSSDSDIVDTVTTGAMQEDTSIFSTSGVQESTQSDNIEDSSDMHASHKSHEAAEAEAQQATPVFNDTIDQASHRSPLSGRYEEGAIEQGLDQVVNITETVASTGSDPIASLDAQTKSSDSDGHPSMSCEELFDLSAPIESQMEVQTLPNKSDEATAAMSNAAILASMPSPLPNKTPAGKLLPIFSGSEQEEDTAFLADFLLRAKASKAAREAATILQPVNEINSPKKISSPVQQTRLEASVRVTEQPAKDETADIEPITSTPAEADEQTVEASASSPLRRSTRASNTRLPRPQTLPPVPQFGPVLPSQQTTLPNTIQLKRATGNEFVFNAKPQQTVQMMTRTNTKRNQGNAVHVDVRLQQLKTVDSGDQSNEPTAQSNSPTKKRKRSKEDDSKSSARSKKNVKWQEELVSYREATPTASEPTLPASDDFAAIEAAAQAEALQSMTESFSIPDSSSGEQTTEDDVQASQNQDGSAKVKVRKMRKINVGNVNGTPAPKKRTRSQMHAQTEAEALPTNSGEAFQSRLGGEVKPKLSIPVPTTSSTSKSSSSLVAETQRKLDGKRRLRART